ncbi:MAG: MaoC/PaaZ C-terminal domain-containing protein [Massilia sp.]
MLKLFYEDLLPGFSCAVEPFTLTSREITNFARQWDPQPFHLGETDHSEIGQGQSASGLHSMSATLRQFVLADIFSGNIVLGVGFESVRFRAPVMAGDVLRASALLVEKRPMRTRPHLGLLTWQITVQRQGQTVLDFQVINLIRVRPQPLAHVQLD